MRTYETIIIIHPETAGDAYTGVVDKYKGILDELGASTIAVEEWGTRKMAYIVKKQERGTYVLFAYEGNPDSIRELERRLRIDDNVIKFMTVQLEGGYEPSGFVRKVEESETASPAKEESSEKAPEAKKEAAKEEAAEEASDSAKTEEETA
ncbi:MAG: 30S ribosomal protein S6 [Desulfuromonas sp.]|nr:MAG: 30S ribosomal protein S6 [Desulfuromonas sp.]